MMSKTKRGYISLLSGLIFDASGERLTPTYSVKRGVRYRYYVSRSLVTGSSRRPGQRIPALELEALVRRRVQEWLGDRPAMLDMVQNYTSDKGLRQQLIAGWERIIAVWSGLAALSREALTTCAVHTSNNIIQGGTSEQLSIMDRDTVEACRLVLGMRCGSA
jgi:hypothetical protein